MFIDVDKDTLEVLIVARDECRNSIYKIQLQAKNDVEVLALVSVLHPIRVYYSDEIGRDLESR